MQAAIEGRAEVLLTIYLLSLFLISSFLDGKIKHRYFTCSNSLINLCHSYLNVEEKNKYLIVCSNFKRELLRTCYKRADTDEPEEERYGDLLRDLFITDVIKFALPFEYCVLRHSPHLPLENLETFSSNTISLLIDFLPQLYELSTVYRSESAKVLRLLDELIYTIRFTLKQAQTVASYDRAVKAKLLFEKFSYILNDRALGYGYTHLVKTLLKPNRISKRPKSDFDSGLRKKKLTDDGPPQIPNPSVCVKDKAGKSPKTCDESSDKDKAGKSPKARDESSDKDKAGKSPKARDESSDKDKAGKSPKARDESSDKDKAGKSPKARDESSDKDKAGKSLEDLDDLDANSQNAEDAVTHADNDLNIIARFKQTECGPSQQTGLPANVLERNNSIDTKCDTTATHDLVRSCISIANCLNEKFWETQSSHEQNRLSNRIPAYVTPRTKPDLLPAWYDWLIARFIPRDTRPHRPSTPPLNPNTSLALTGELLRQRMSQRNYRIASMVHLQGFRLLDMSAAGLYLDEDEDVFRCFRCSFAVPRSRWPEEENPWEVHRRMSPDCPLVNADAQHAQGRQLRSSE